MTFPNTPGAAPQAEMPLFVDLDGTLLRTDLLHESFLDRLKHDWLVPLRALAWLLRGKAALKAALARDCELVVADLPYNQDVIDHIRVARISGRHVYLATASHLSLARQVAAHLGLFDGVIATEGAENISGRAKLARLHEIVGSYRFEYVGNSAADIPVFEACARSSVVVPDSAARRWLARNPERAQALGDYPSLRSALSERLRALRPHQWLKNLLLALPLVVAHKAFDLTSPLRH